MADEKEIDYRAELKATLGEFEKAAAKGDEAAKALYAGVTGLAGLTLTALRGTQFEKQADLLALEMAKAGMTPETIRNAPLKVRTTGGADIYKVVAHLEKAKQAADAPARALPRMEPMEEPKPGPK